MSGIRNKQSKKSAKNSSNLIYKKKPHANAEIVQEGKRACPICGEEMRTATENNLIIDVCDEHGVWLDSGELEKIKLKISSKNNRSKRKAIAKAKEEGVKDGVIFGWWALFF